MTDRRYGRFKYGSTGILYGPSDGMTTLAWDVSFDWNGDGLFESNESNRLLSVSVSRGRQGMINENGVGFREVPTGRAVIRLANYDGRYDAWNTSSPLYPNVKYGVEVRIRVRPISGSTIYPVFRGVVESMSPSGYGQRPTLDVTIQDGLSYLRNTYTRVQLMVNVGLDDAITYLVDSSGYKWGKNIDVSSDVITYWWANGNTHTMTEIDKLTSSFIGHFFADRENRASFVARAAPHDVTTTFGQDELLRDVGNPQPYEIYRNVVRLKVHPRNNATSGTIFQLTGNPSIQGSGGKLTIWADYSYANRSSPARNVITPVATTDYLLNTAPDGSGTNITSSLSVVFTDFGDTAKLELTNNNASTGYIRLLKIRGEAIYETDTLDVSAISGEATTSNWRELFLDLVWMQDVNTADDIASVQGNFWIMSNAMPIIRVDNRPEKQFNVELFDIIEVDLTDLGLPYDSYRVGGIEHRTEKSESCQSVVSTFWLEPYISGSGYFQWDAGLLWDQTPPEIVFGW